jgi:LPXTG-motif cell wall-anchored protein
MRRCLCLLPIVFALSIPPARAAAPSPTTTDLVRSTLGATTAIAAQGPSDVMVQVSTYPAGAVRPWFASPGPTFVAVKSGTVTVHRGDATGCTSQAFSAGQGYFAPAGEARLIRNDGTQSAEIYVARVALPVGAQPRVDAKNPGGANCPDAKPGEPQPTTTDLGRSTVQAPVAVDAKETSDLAVQVSTYPVGAVRPWFASPGATFVVVKSGAVTVHRGDATGCSSQTFSAGQGYFAPAAEARLIRNDGTQTAEIIVARPALPVGAAPRIDATNPGGANCPEVEPTQGTSALPRTGGPAHTTLPFAAAFLILGGAGIALGRRSAHPTATRR